MQFPRLSLKRPAHSLAILALALVLGLSVWFIRRTPTTAEAGLTAGDQATGFLERPAERTSDLPLPDEVPTPEPEDPLLPGVKAEIARALSIASDRSGGRVNAGNVTVAVHVRSIGRSTGSGDQGTRVALEADRALRPASSLKLVTMAAALFQLGPEWNFETAFEAVGQVADGRLTGDLVVRAAGDPLYEEGRDGALDPWLEGLARDLKQAGVGAVSGALVLDEEAFLDPGPGPSWPDANQHWQDYCALAGGFSANAGCLTAVIEPAAVGALARVSLFPRHHGLARRGAVHTRGKRTQLNVAVEARPTGVLVRGDFPADVQRWSTRFAHPDPVALFGHAVVGGLAQRGIVIDGGWRRERGAAGAPGGTAVASIRSPLASTLVPVLTHSNNSVADQVLFAAAHAQLGDGTRAGGLAFTRGALTAAGVPSDGFVQVDGSGLSRDNRVSARQLTALLAAVLGGDPVAAERFTAALPLAGETGSLAKRMRSGAARGHVRAKTGWIGGTSALAGIAESVSGARLLFAILVDYPVVSGLNTHAWKPMQDAICERLVLGDA